MAWTWLLLAWALGAMQIDPTTRAGFTLHVRWGQIVQGRFPQVEGHIEVDDEGRQRVHLRLDAGKVEIVGYPRYTRFARGKNFFDVARHPLVEFVSDPYTPQLLHDGGALDGELRLHGVHRRERFIVAPTSCARPGLDCDIVAEGTVHRSHYGLGSWKMALREPVQFTLRVRTREVAP